MWTSAAPMGDVGRWTRGDFFGREPKKFMGGGARLTLVAGNGFLGGSEFLPLMKIKLLNSKSWKNWWYIYMHDHACIYIPVYVYIYMYKFTKWQSIYDGRKEQRSQERNLELVSLLGCPILNGKRSNHMYIATWLVLATNNEVSENQVFGRN